MSGSPKGLEIERVWLLARLPEIPRGAETWEIEQGYLPEETGGRVRRIRRADGSVERWHTVKRGEGVVREETERPLDEDEFARLWPLTAGRRIAKTRHRVRDGDRVWELDRFHALPLVMLEVELPDERTPVTPPSWAAPFVEREVSADPRYRNAALALRGVPTS